MFSYLLKRISIGRQIKRDKRLYRKALSLREKELDSYKGKQFISKEAYSEFLNFNDKETFRLELIEKKYGTDSEMFRSAKQRYFSESNKLYRRSTNRLANDINAGVNPKVVGGIVGGVGVIGGGIGAYYLMNNRDNNDPVVQLPVTEPDEYESLDIPDFLPSDPFELVSKNQSLSSEQAKER